MTIIEEIYIVLTAIPKRIGNALAWILNLI
jgi:hypothetical protein